MPVCSDGACGYTAIPDCIPQELEEESIDCSDAEQCPDKGQDCDMRVCSDGKCGYSKIPDCIPDTPEEPESPGVNDSTSDCQCTSDR